MTRQTLPDAIVPVDPTLLSLDAAVATTTAARDAYRAHLRAQTAAATPRWLTIGQVRERIGAPSDRAAGDALRRMGVPVVRAGRARVVDADALDAALASQAKPLRRPPVTTTAPTPAPVEDDGAEGCLARAGLRVVGSR